jgi:SAM-dependent methyltransferase
MKQNDKSRALVNLGCGAVRPSGWTNCDSSLNSLGQRYPGLRVITSRLLKSTAYTSPAFYLNVCRHWPFPDSAVDVVYASHLLEHLTTSSAQHFLHECQRTLKPSGVLRIVVPDLLALAQYYVAKADSDSTAARDFLWKLDLHFENMCPPERGRVVRLVNWLQGCPHQHKYMYDLASLKALLQDHEFVSIEVSEYAKSGKIPEIRDVEAGRERYTPSIYLECCKAPRAH